MENLIKLRKAHKLKQSDMAKIIGVSVAAYGFYETGRRQASYETLQMLADYFNVSVDYLLGRENKNADRAIKDEIDVSELEMYPIPLLGHVVAGIPIESQENLEGYVFINHKPKEEYFALKVFGDSMINAGIPDGAILIVHKQSYAENGAVVVAFLNGEQTVKYFKMFNDDIYLTPANNNYLPIPVRPTDDFIILGKVVEIRVTL